METDFKVNCPYCLEEIWQEFYPEDGLKQEMVIDCEVCCRPSLYVIDFNQDVHNQLQVTPTN